MQNMQEAAKYFSEMSPQARFSNELVLQFLVLSVLNTWVQNDLLWEWPVFTLKMCCGLMLLCCQVLIAWLMLLNCAPQDHRIQALKTKADTVKYLWHVGRQ